MKNGLGHVLAWDRSISSPRQRSLGVYLLVLAFLFLWGCAGVGDGAPVAEPTASLASPGQPETSETAELSAVVEPAETLEPTERLVPSSTEVKAESAEVRLDGLTEVQQQWNGYWYGSFQITEAFGEIWEESADYHGDYYAYIRLDEDGLGFFDGRSTPFDIDEPYFSDFSMWILADENHFEQIGDDAWFFEMDIVEGENGKDFRFEPMPENKDMMVMAGRFVDPDGEPGDGYLFQITLLRWGEQWDLSVNATRPPGYSVYEEALVQGMTPADYPQEEQVDGADGP